MSENIKKILEKRNCVVGRGGKYLRVKTDIGINDPDNLAEEFHYDYEYVFTNRNVKFFVQLFPNVNAEGDIKFEIDGALWNVFINDYGDFNVVDGRIVPIEGYTPIIDELLEGMPVEYVLVKEYHGGGNRLQRLRRKKEELELLSEKGRARADFLCGEYKRPELLESTTTAEELDLFMREIYNWDGGVELPYYIAMHENCTLATALRIFWEGDGIAMFMEDFEDSDSAEWIKNWKYLLKTVRKRIVGGAYPRGTLSYEIPLNSALREEMRKQGAEDILLTDLKDK